MESLFRWLASILAGILEKFGDPQLQSKLDSFNARVAEAEKKEKDAAQLENESRLAYQKSLDNRKMWDSLLKESQANEEAAEAKLRASQDRVKAILDETDKAKAIIDSRSDSAVLRGDV